MGSPAPSCAVDSRTAPAAPGLPGAAACGRSALAGRKAASPKASTERMPAFLGTCMTSIVGGAVGSGPPARTQSRSFSSRSMFSASRGAALSAMRRPPHHGQNPRPLHEKATSASRPQPPQRTRARPWARTPQRRADNGQLPAVVLVQPKSFRRGTLSRVSCGHAGRDEPEPGDSTLFPHELARVLIVRARTMTSTARRGASI